MENVRHAVEQICLISEQPAPNYIGAVCIPKKLKKAHFLVTHRMERRAEQLAAIMKKNGIRVEIYMLSDTDPESVFSLLEKIPLQKDSTVAVNVTGGTKVMSLTALEWANMCGHIPFYVDTEKSRILILQNRFTAYEYSARLKVRDILQLQGFYFGRRKPPRIEPVRQREIFHKIAEYCIANPESLRLVNDTLSSASRGYGYLYCQISSAEIPLFSLFESLGKASIGGDKVSFCSEEDMKWCNGLWLETYVHSVLFKMKQDGVIDDWSCDFEFYSDREDAENEDMPLKRNGYYNEFDAAFSARGRLFVMECKTRSFERHGNRPLTNDRNKMTDIAYKLDALTQKAGGSFARGILISTGDIPQNDRKRLEEAHHIIIYGKDILSLQDRLRALLK
ncbi:MAG: Card1-like endonuclease domain-containing protein [Desulfovibrionaceae bacterium]